MEFSRRPTEPAVSSLYGLPNVKLPNWGGVSVIFKLSNESVPVSLSQTRATRHGQCTAGPGDPALTALAPSLASARDLILAYQRRIMSCPSHWSCFDWVCPGPRTPGQFQWLKFPESVRVTAWLYPGVQSLENNAGSGSRARPALGIMIDICYGTTAIWNLGTLLYSTFFGYIPPWLYSTSQTAI